MSATGQPPRLAAERLGELLVNKGIITPGDLREALAAQLASRGYVPLGEILIQQKKITAPQLAKVFKAHDKRSKLGEVLLRAGAITKEQLQLALKQQSAYRLPLGQLLVRLGYITDEAMRQSLAQQLNVPYVELDRYSLDPALARTVNRSYARRHNLVPISCVGKTLTICMDNPADEPAVEELTRSTGRSVRVVTASHDAIEGAFARLYKNEPETAGSAKPAPARVEIVSEEAERPTGATYGAEYQQLRNADTIVRKLLSLAIERRTSDVHIEMLSSRLSIRFRTDGVLEDPRLGSLQDACNASAREIISRLKILAGMDIAERRRPQDGSFRLRFDRGGKQDKVDLRLSIVPSVYGESVVLRVLDKAQQPASIEALGFPLEAAQQFRQLLRRPNGILLVTGPTGSGKSTTLYAALKALYRPQIRIVTIEDPVEHVYEQFSQSEVNEQIGNTFASYLRAFLRHDPEIIMVGEIRDQETAEVAFRAAQTGHLLLSTLHTNTAVAAVTRLRDLGIDANLIASSLIGVLGQRLVRQLCAHCRTSYTPSPEVARQFFRDGVAPFPLQKGQGCQQCNFTGYHGRQAVVELWTPDDEDAILITQEAPSQQLQTSAARSTICMAACAWDLLLQGQTTLEELIRMLPYSVIAEMKTIDVRPKEEASPTQFNRRHAADRVAV